MDKNEYIKSWAEKLSLTVEEVEAEFLKVYESEKELHPDLSDDQKTLRSLQRLALMYKKQLKSPAEGFEGVIIGTSTPFDMAAKQRREALELFREDPQTAVGQGVTDEEGTPLDTRAEWGSGRPNPMFGKPLPETNYIRNVWGIAKKKKDAAPKLFQMSITGSKASNILPVFKPVRFMAIDKSQEPTAYKLNSSQFTNFVVDTNLNLPKYKDLVNNVLGLTKISALEDYHKLNGTDFNSIVCIEADVSLLNLEPTAFGSRIMLVDDPEATLENLDSNAVTCWIGEETEINFAEGSKVLVVGRTGQSFKKDENKNVTDELGDVTINVFGVYALPEYKIELPEEVKPVTEDNLI